MEKICLMEDVKRNEYPGRGIVIGMSEDGKNACMAYFIMGRSENSRNRIFVEESDGLKTKAYDDSKLTDPSLIIYAPVRVLDEKTIVTNGDQTDTIYEFLKSHKTFEEALATRTFEPDPPNFTPRISALVTKSGSDFSYQLSILKSNHGREKSALRFFYHYETPIAWEVHFIHTYRENGNPIPSFEGEPKCVGIRGDIDTFSKKLWASLNENHKVSLFVRYLSLEDNTFQTRIFNKNNGD